MMTFIPMELERESSEMELALFTSSTASISLSPIGKSPLPLTMRLVLLRLSRDPKLTGHGETTTLGSTAQSVQAAGTLPFTTRISLRLPHKQLRNLELPITQVKLPIPSSLMEQ